MVCDNKQPQMNAKTTSFYNVLPFLRCLPYPETTQIAKRQWHLEGTWRDFAPKKGQRKLLVSEGICTAKAVFLPTPRLLLGLFWGLFFAFSVNRN